MPEVDEFWDKRIAEIIAADNEGRLTEWESEFIQNIAGRTHLSEKQFNVVKRLVYKLEFDNVDEYVRKKL